MKTTFLLLLFGSVAVAVCSSAESGFREISRAALGDAKHVFEIVGGGVSPGLPFLKRIEVGKDSVVFMVRNETQKSIAPDIKAEFFNRYGMQICVFEGSFDPEEVQPGGVGVTQFGLTYPQLESVFMSSTIRLPVDWKELRFVRLDVNSRGHYSSPQHDSDPRRPRPQIVKQQQVRPAILAENKFGTQNVGLTVIDARWSNYGAYLQRMIDAVQFQWERLILSTNAIPAGGSTVSVKFIMNDEGKITEIKHVGQSATSGETATRACVAAIKDRSPYGPWTKDMKAVLGTQQEMTFTFHFQ